MNYVEYLPEILREILDYQGLASGLDPETAEIREWSGKIPEECCAETAGEDGIKRFERMLGIQNTGSLSLEQRRVQVLGRLRNLPPFSMGWLFEKLQAECGEGNFYASEDTERFRLQVGINQNAAGNIQPLCDSLRQTIPANVELHIGLLYRYLFPGKFGVVIRTGDIIRGKERENGTV